MNLLDADDTACSVTVVMPTYNGASVIGAAIESLRVQTMESWRLLVIDDASTDTTEQVVRAFNDERVSFLWHENNVGYQKNLRRGLELVKRGRIFLLAQDDILERDALDRTLSAMDRNNVRAVTRPYYWFEGDPRRPIRIKHALGYESEDVRIVSISSSANDIAETLGSLDQLSGLCFNADALVIWPVSDDMFTAHVYPVSESILNDGIGVLGKWTVAVRTEVSQSRSVSSAYDISPLATWVKLINTQIAPSISARKAEAIKRKLAKDHVNGLFQIFHFSRFGRRGAWRESREILKVSPDLIYRSHLVIVLLWITLVPRGVSWRILDSLKRHLGSWLFRNTRSLAVVPVLKDKKSG
jgi:glycosyltransferase involved in cell wall biosynthesis